MLQTEQVAQAINDFIKKTNLPGYDGDYSIHLVIDGTMYVLSVNDSRVDEDSYDGYSTNLIINCVDITVDD